MRERGITFALLIASVTAFSLLQSLVIPALPVIREILGTSDRGVTWVVTAYLLSAAICTPLVGHAGDRLGQERTLGVVLSVLCLGCLLAGLATDLRLMICARAMQGVGGAVVPLAFGIVRTRLASHSMPGAIGVLATLGGVGGSVGLVISGPVVELMGYRWLFWLPMLAIAVAAIVAFAVYRSAAKGLWNGWPVLSACYLSIGFACLLIAVTNAPSWGWISVKTGVVAAGAVVFGGLWVRRELSIVDPLVDIRLIFLPPLLFANVLAFLWGLVIYPSYVFVPLLAHASGSVSGFDPSVFDSGLIVLPMAISSFAAGLGAGSVMRRFGVRPTVLVACLTVAAATASNAVSGHGRASTAILLGIQGIGLGLLMAGIASLVVELAPARRIAVASAMTVNVRSIGGATGTAVLAAVVGSSGVVDDSRYPSNTGLSVGFGILSVAMLVATAVACLLPRADAS